MDRRSVLSASLAAGAAGTLSTPATAQGQLRLRVGNVWSNQADGRGGLVADLGARLQGLSGGAVSVESVDLGGLAPNAMLAALRSGEITAIAGAEEFWTVEHPGFGIFTATPGGMVERELEAWIRVDRGQTAWDTFAAEFGLKSLYLGDTGAEYTWSKGALTSMDQLSGAAVATRGLATDLYTRVGATVRPLAPGVMNPGDATVTEPGPIADLATLGGLGFTHLNMATLTRPSSAMSWTFTKAGWDGFSDSQRALLDAAAMAQSHVIAAQGMKRNAVARQVFGLASAVTVEQLPQPMFTTMMDEARGMYSELQARDAQSRALLSEYSRFGEAVQSWTRVADAPFTLARARTATARG